MRAHNEAFAHYHALCLLHPDQKHEQKEPGVGPRERGRRGGRHERGGGRGHFPDTSLTLPLGVDRGGRHERGGGRGGRRAVARNVATNHTSGRTRTLLRGGRGAHHGRDRGAQYAVGSRAAAENTSRTWAESVERYQPAEAQAQAERWERGSNREGKREGKRDGCHWHGSVLLCNS